MYMQIYAETQSVTTNTHTHAHTTVLCTLTPLHRSHFIATPEIKVPLAKEGCRGRREEKDRGGEKQRRDRRRETEAIDRLELAQSGIELYHKRRASQQEAL